MTYPTPCPSRDAADGVLLARVRQALAPEFEIASEIGRGRTAVVYLARDRRLLHQVALKVLLPELVRSDDAAEHFLAMARTTASLEHPNIVPVYGAGESDGLRFVAMRYVDGCSLDHLLRAARERRVPLALACHLLAEVARALDYAHAEGVIHGDLRPENVLIDGKRGRAIVTDFGAGSHDAAPELADGGPPTFASDQYALGALAYRLLTGAPPALASADEGTTTLARDGRRQIRRVNPACPIGLETAVLRMLAPSPEARWPRVSDALAVLLRHVGSEVAQQKELQARVAALAVAAAPDVAAEAPAPAPPDRGRGQAPRRALVAPAEVREIELPFRDASFASGLAVDRGTDGGRVAPRSAPRAARRLRWRAPGGLAIVLAGTAVAATSVRRSGDSAAPTPRAAPPHAGPADAAPHAVATPAASEPPAAAADSALAVRVVVVRDRDTLAVGDSVRLRVTLVGRDGAPVPWPAATRVRWRSGDTARARVSPNGWVRATGGGGAVTIAAAAGGARGRTRLVIVPAPAAAPPADVASHAGGEIEAAVPSRAEAEALVRPFVRALDARELGAMARVLTAPGGGGPGDVTRWLRSRRDFLATLDTLGAVRESAGVAVVEFRVALAWTTRSLKDLHRGGTRRAAAPWFRATLARDSAGWELREVAPIDRFPP